MQVTRIAVASQDQRGTIADILSREPIDAVTIIVSRKGAIRGNHFHKDTVQWVYVLEGRLIVAAMRQGAPREEREVGVGELVRHDPLESHSMMALEDSRFLVLTRGPRAGQDYESDTFRLGTPLQVAPPGGTLPK